MKSAKDIYEQALRLAEAESFKGWTGKDYTEESIKRIEKLYEITHKYVENLTRHLTGTDWLPNDKSDVKVERCIYAKF